MHIQKMFVIIAFNEALLARAVGLLALIPVVGPKLEQPFKTFLEKQKKKFHRKPGTGPSGQVSYIGVLGLASYWSLLDSFICR